MLVMTSWLSVCVLVVCTDPDGTRLYHPSGGERSTRLQLAQPGTDQQGPMPMLHDSPTPIC